jgi:predicted ATPase
MYLSRFGVTNYKCLGDIDIPLTPIHVLIGENDAGKTSLLEAMLINCDENAIKSLTHYRSFRELVNHHSKSSVIDFEGQWECRDQNAYNQIVRLGFRLEHSDQIQNLYFTSKDWVYIDSNKLVRDTRTNITINESDPNIQFSSDRIQREYIHYVDLTKSTSKYNFDPRIMASPSVSDPIRNFRLDPDGFGLANILDDILGNNPKKFISLSDTFCEYFPQFTSVQLKTSDALRRRYDEKGILLSREDNGRGIFFETKSGNAIRAENASDGTILFLGFLALAYLPEPPNLLLIEEPENGIYPKRLEQVINLLKALITRDEGVRFPQIIMTTHSPYLLSYFQPEEVTFLSRPKNDPSGPVRARPLRDAPNIHERMHGGQYYLGELWYNLSEEELFGEVECE